MKRISAQDIASVLSNCPIFSSIKKTNLKKIIADSQKLTFSAGEQIFRPSQKAERFFVIISGKVRIFKVSPKGDEQILHIYGQGDTFGEAAMLSGIKYPAYCEALGETSLLAICRDALRDQIGQNPDIAMGMLAGLSGKLREFNRLIEELSLKEVPARVAGVLLESYRRSGKKEVHLGITKRQLAARVGTVAETLSRALKKMKDSGLIEVKGSVFILLNVDGLEDLAD